MSSTQMYVIKRNGEHQEIKLDNITKRIKELCYGLNDQFIDPAAITIKIVSGFHNKISTYDIDILAAETCAYMSQIHPDFSILAARIAISNLHKNTLNSFADTCDKLKNNKDKQHKPAPLLSDNVWEFINNNRKILDDNINNSNDYNYNYFGYKTLEKSYLLKVNNKIVERPQYMLMRVACEIHINNINKVIESYNMMSKGYFTHATPTLYNAGLPKPQMSSCFLLTMQEDSIEGIYDTLKKCATISKTAGGIGLTASNIRSNGSYIRGSGGHSNGIIPMLRNFNETARYVNQGGKRNGSFAIYLEPWHADIFEFIELRKNHGNEESRCRDLFLGLWIPDLFMKRVKDNENWTLFCPNETLDEEGKCLIDIWGDEFENRYIQLESENKGVKTIKAQDLWFRILECQTETGTPYMCYKDNVNKRSNQQNLGTIHCSNLCTEIMEYTSANEVAVCNLASIALPMFVKNGKFNFNELYKITKIVTYNLNNVIDRNYYPLKEARLSNLKNRPIGIGVQGLADTFIQMKYPFESDMASILNKNIFETIYFAACETSCELAEQFGPYDTFKGSPSSKGILQFDMWGVSPQSNMWNWNDLKEKIIKYGLRNSLLVAPMPTASTAQILGNNESFEPYTQNIYVRRVMSGEFVQINRYLLNDLIKLELWNDDMKNELIKHNGSVQQLNLPDHIKELYKTVWEIKQKKILDMAIDRAPFIDQSMSLNIHMINPTKQKLSSMHFHGWSSGLKTGMYYLRTKAAVDAIKFTVDNSIKPNKEKPQQYASKYECISCGS